MSIDTEPAPLVIRAKRKVYHPEWISFPTRILDHLTEFHKTKRTVIRSRYGGRKDRKFEGTGFFGVAQDRGRWWLVAPDAYPSIQPAVTSVRMESERNDAAARERYGNLERRAEAAVRLLRDTGFTAIGAWSANDLLRHVKDPLPDPTTLGFMSGFAKSKQLKVRQSGHTGFLHDCMPVFHPEFESFCSEYAKQLANTKDDRLLVGHFSDNELPAPVKTLDNFLSLDTADPRLAPGRSAAEDWLRRRRGAIVPIADLSNEDRDAFLEFVYERYLQVVGGAARKHDPNHLHFGPRLWGPSMISPGIVRACGRHLEAIAITPIPVGPRSGFARHVAERGRETVPRYRVLRQRNGPGLPKTTGAGWTVHTQQERAYSTSISRSR